MHKWANDYDASTCQTYRRNICPDDEESVICGDVRQLDIESLGDIDAFAFGFPCNDFSVVGEQKGFDGVFGPLYSYGVKVLKKYKPLWFLAENVGGLKSANDGKAFERIKKDLIDAGYKIYPNLYKFEEYGVPQVRHRMIIVGIRADLPYEYKVPSTEKYRNLDVTCKTAIEKPPIPKDAANNELTKQSATVVERLKHIKPGQNAFTANLPVFSDIFNVLLFEKNVIQQQYLKAGSTESVYKAENGEYHNQIRDILKEYMNGCLLKIGSLGMENQSTLDNYIAVRVMGYDYTKYRSQTDRKKFPILPVITIVLNFADKPWKERKSLHGIMDIPEEFKPYVQDYEVKVFDIAFLEDEVIERFTSDFKIVAKFFKNKRLGSGELFGEDKITHVQEFIDFLAVFTNDDRYREIKQELWVMEKEGRSVTMCSVAQALEEKGIEKGIKQGYISMIQRLLHKGYTKEKIVEILECTEEEFSEAESGLLVNVKN